MPSLDTHLRLLDFSTQLADVNTLLGQAEVRTTFWGSRVVEVNGFTGSVYLEDITRRILTASSQRSDANDLSPEERLTGIEIVKKLKNFYRISNTQIQNSNFLTKFLNWIREFSFFYNRRSDQADSKFRAYPEKEFRAQFGNAPSHGSITHVRTLLGHALPGASVKLLASEAQIRSKLVQD